MWEEYGDEVQFLVVYIREAHALDSYLPKGGEHDPILEDPTTAQERREVAQVCLSRLALEPMPAVVDGLDDAVSRAYDAWPDRLALVGISGEVAYHGGPGPDGFVPAELEAAIRRELELEVESAAETAIASLPEIEPTDARVRWNAERGYVRDAAGAWVREVELAARAQGLVPMDLEFVRAEEADRFAGGAFRCAGEWFDQIEANDFHARLSHPWRIPSQHFQAYSTAPRATTLLALEQMERTRADLVRLYGRAPDLPATVILCRSLEQYNLFATQPYDGAEQVAPELTGRAAFYHSFPCESWLDVAHGFDTPGAAAAYWDESSEAGRAWGPYAVRHAAGLAFAEGLDPSYEALRRYRSKPIQGLDLELYRLEQQLPLWLRYGGATYVERCFLDPSAANPSWAREWTEAELAELGGPLPMEFFLDWEPGPSEVALSRRWTLQAGLVTAFLLDNPSPDVESAHLALRTALLRERGVERSVAVLERALLASDAMPEHDKE